MIPTPSHLTSSVARRGVAARLLLACGLLAAAQAAWSQGAAPALIKIDANQRQHAGVQTVAAGSALPADSGATEHQLVGTVVAAPEGTVVLSAMVAGVVQQVHASPLQTVRAGTPVVTLVSQQLMEWQRDYLQLATQSALAQKKQARDEALYADGIIARARLEESRGAALQASVMASERRQALRAAGMGQAPLQQLLDKQTMSPTLTLAAGAAGTLVELPLVPGQRVEGGAPLAKIAREGALWLELQATPQLAARIRVGDSLQVTGCGTAKVQALSPHLNAGNQSVLVRARPERNDGCLKLNQFVDARLAGGAAPAGSVALPASAVVQREGTSYVFVQRGADFIAVPVSTAPAGAQTVWVRSKRGDPIEAGSHVAVRGVAAIKGAWLGLGAPEEGAR